MYNCTTPREPFAAPGSPSSGPIQLALLLRCVAISFFTSSGESFGRSIVSVSLLSLP